MGTTYKVLGKQATAQSSLAITNKVLSANVATLTTSTDHNLIIGQTVNILLTTPDSSFDGVHVVTSAPTTTTFTYESINSNVASAATTGTATGFTWYTLYTCPVDTSAVISSLIVNNRNNGGGYYQIAIADSTTVAAEDYIVYNDLAAANETIGLTLGLTLDSTNKYLMVASSDADFTFQAHGMEITA